MFVNSGASVEYLGYNWTDKKTLESMIPNSIQLITPNLISQNQYDKKDENTTPKKWMNFFKEQKFYILICTNKHLACLYDNQYAPSILLW